MRCPSRIQNASDKQYTFTFTNLPYDVITGGMPVRGVLTTSCCCAPSWEENHCEDWQLVMGGAEWHTYDDHASTTCGWESENGVTVAFPCECTCDPLILKFGPFTISTEYGPCSYEIHITPVY